MGRHRRSDYLFTDNSGGNRTANRETKERTKITRCSNTRDVQTRKIGLKLCAEAGVSVSRFERIKDSRSVEKRYIVHFGAVACGKNDLMNVKRRVVLQ